MQFGPQERWLERDGFEVVEVKPAEFDAGVSIGGPVGPGAAKDCGGFGKIA